MEYFIWPYDWATFTRILLADRIGPQFAQFAISVLALGYIEHFLVRGEEQTVGCGRVESHPHRLPASVRLPFQPIDGLVIQLHVVTEVAVTWIGKPNPTLAVDSKIIRAIETLPLEFGTDYNRFTPFRVLYHASTAAFACVHKTVTIRH